MPHVDLEICYEAHEDFDWKLPFSTADVRRGLEHAVDGAGSALARGDGVAGRYECEASRTVCGWLASAALKAAVSQNQRRIALMVRPTTVRLETGEVSYRFSQQDGRWAFDSVWVRGRKTALPLSRDDSFFLGGGEAKELAVVTNSSERKAIRFTGLNMAGRSL